jgi:hypothetical protein
MATNREDKYPQARITIDFSRISDQEFDPGKQLRVATVRGGAVLDQKVVTPAKEKNPRSFEVALSLGEPQDGVSGAEVVVAPADDEQNVLSKLTARKFVYGASERIDAGVLFVLPSIYKWWRFCWFPRTYRVTGRVVRHEADCIHPVGAAVVELYDVDYCWWWYNQQIVTSGTTDLDGFFDISFTWCVPLWCLFEIVRPPLYIDPDLRDRLRRIMEDRLRIPFPFPPPPPDPWEWERFLDGVGVELPGMRRPTLSHAVEAPLLRTRMVASAVASPASSATRALATTAVSSPALTATAAKINWRDVFGDIIFWPPCENPCDWNPDIKIRVTQTQPSGTVVIYQDTFAQVRWNLAGDLLNLTLEANASALFSDACRPDPLLGNCMLFERVGWFNVSQIYQPDISAGTSYGATPDRRDRLGYTVSKDRAWCLVPGVHGDFGLAAGVDYYQVQVARWTNGDILAWDADHAHVPPNGSFSPVDPTALGSFTRTYAEQIGFFYVWRTEPFGPQSVAGIPGLYKSRQRFEHEFRDSHGGANPAPDFVTGWYWDTWAMTRLFDLDTSKFSNGLYSFRLVCYRQTGVDGAGKPILAPVAMGIPGGVGRRCGGLVKPELLTLRLHNDPHRPDCEILTFKKNGVDTISECAIVVLDTTDNVTMEYRALDPDGNLDSYGVTLQHGLGPETNIRSFAGVTIAGSTPQGPDYLDALVDPGSPAIPPFWYGGTWISTVPASAFAALGGSCAFNLRLRAWDRQTNGWSAGAGWGEVGCEKDRAFTVILAADRATYCAQLGCPPRP